MDRLQHCTVNRLIKQLLLTEALQKLLLFAGVFAGDWLLAGGCRAIETGALLSPPRPQWAGSVGTAQNRTEHW